MLKVLSCIDNRFGRRIFGLQTIHRGLRHTLHLQVITLLNRCFIFVVQYFNGVKHIVEKSSHSDVNIWYMDQSKE